MRNRVLRAFQRQFMRGMCGFALALGVLVSGCSMLSSELGNRGGFVDAKLDDKWMVADTKPMRALRAYILIGSITRLAQTRYESERELIVRHVNTAIKVASDVYYCAYSRPGSCVYFDERMAELEVAVLKLLVAVTSQAEDEELFEAISKNLAEAVPLAKTVNSFAKLVDAVTTASDAVTAISSTVGALLKAGQSIYFRGRRLGALYRDSIELNMMAVLSSLDTICAIKTGVFITYNPGNHRYSVATVTDANRRVYRNEGPASVLDGNRIWALENFYGTPAELPEGACQAFKRGFALWQRGAGDLSQWVSFLANDAAQYRGWIIPNEDSFIQASDLIWRSCEHLTSGSSELSDCIGRRRADHGRTDFECAIRLDQDGLALEQAKEVVETEQKAEVRSLPSPYKDRCRLILYAKTVELRVNRRERANTRIHWLSNFTPSTSHPLIRHPGQAY